MTSLPFFTSSSFTSSPSSVLLSSPIYSFEPSEKHLKIPPNEKDDSGISSIFLDSDAHRIYIGTSDGSLYVYSIVLQDSNQNYHLNEDNDNHNNDDFDLNLTLSLTRPSHVHTPSVSASSPSPSSSSSSSPSLDSINLLRLGPSKCLVTLSGGDIYLHSLADFKLESHSGPWTKSQALLFALEASSAHSPPLVAVPCKRRLAIFTLKNSQLLPPKEIVLPHQPRSLVFATPQTLFIGYSTGLYATLALGFSSQSISSLVLSDPFALPLYTSPHSALLPPPPTGLSALATLKPTSFATTLGNLAGPAKKHARNPVVRLGPPTHKVLGLRDHYAALMSTQGKPAADDTCPAVIDYGPNAFVEETVVLGPYIISLVTTPPNAPAAQPIHRLVVHSAATLSHMQTLDLTGQRRLLTVSSSFAPHPGLILCVSTIWDPQKAINKQAIQVLGIKPWSVQIEGLIQLGEYSEALGLLSVLDPSAFSGDRDGLRKRLEGLCALADFVKHHHVDQGQALIEKTMDKFIQLDITPAKVVALYSPRVSGKLSRPREVWEAIFGGRSVETYRNSTNVGLGKRRGSHCESSISATSSLVGGAGDDSASVKSTKLLGLPKPSFEAISSDASIQTVSTIEPLSEGADEKATIEVLIHYLTDRRQHVNKALSKLSLSPARLTSLRSTTLRDSELLFALPDDPIEELDSKLEDLVQVAKIIDTCLFKSYLAVKPAMLGPLCRLDNWCEVDEVEVFLMDAKRFRELLDLYNGKGLHDRALSLLKQMGESEPDTEEQIGPTISYLQKLGPQHLDLILTTSRWVLSHSTTPALLERALEIFTADLSTVEMLPKKLVMIFLEKENAGACRVYVEWLVKSVGSDDVEVHEKLIHLYIGEFRRLKATAATAEGNDQVAEAAAEEIYSRLLDHLVYSERYSANWVLGRLPLEEMDEARALTLGRIGQHDAALAIYVHRIGNLAMAEEYCKRVHRSVGGGAGESIFLILLRTYLRPNPTVNPSPKLSNAMRLEAALSLISTEGSHIGSIDVVLDLLPKFVGLKSLAIYVGKSFRKLDQVGKEVKVLKACCERIEEKLGWDVVALEQRCIKVDDRRLCVGCGKRLGNSVISVHSPFGEVTHYQCRCNGRSILEGGGGDRESKSGGGSGGRDTGIGISGRFKKLR